MQIEKEDEDKLGLEDMLHKFLQLYASRVFSKLSYAKKGNEVLEPEKFPETLIQVKLVGCDFLGGGNACEERESFIFPCHMVASFEIVELISGSMTGKIFASIDLQLYD
ncbi:uncharacterized protein LOC121751287 [Salvia splendens]|uniref:uncharacterized protein LOC121751287 n=1 Tax=Salvia splendens TaxID=180675 RepID=UPI001C275CEA|nr:uncharacterized protein LOC121751287 [Salvia splendens]